MLDAAAEQRILWLSIGVTVAVSLFGVVFGLLSGSLSIVFDGVFSAIDAAMSGLALFVSRLVTHPGDNRRFQFGYWHIEPMVLAFNGGTLMLLCFYAFLNAVDSFLAGGRQLAFDWAIAYAVIVCAACFGMFFYERRRNRSIGSDFLRLDAQSWLMSAAISSALLVAFAAAMPMQGHAVWGAYALCRPRSACSPDARPRLRADPHRAQGAERNPADHAARARRAGAKVMQKVVAKYDFRSFTSYVAKVGRAQFIEIHIAVTPDWPLTSIAAANSIRREIGDAIGGEGPQRWITIDFTADPRWL